MTRLANGRAPAQARRPRPAPKLADLALVLLAFLSLAAPAVAISPPSAAALIDGVKRGSYVLLIRHARAPGNGDPSSFRLGDCSTQRNLSADGRRQSARIGARLRGYGLARAAVFTSQWCRCRETARLLDLGPPRDLPALNSFYGAMGRRDSQTRALRRFLATGRPAGPVVLVTHYVNIQAIAGYAPASGEIVVVRPGADGRATVVGTLKTN